MCAELESDVRTRFVKSPSDLLGIDALILPGGESTVMTKLLDTSSLLEPMDELIESGMPVLGTCAGLILLADVFSVLDCDVVRNAYGTQEDSFEDDVAFLPSHSHERVAFIRAPRIMKAGPKVTVIAEKDDQIVGVTQDNMMGLTFHPEIARTSTFHDFFVRMILGRVASHS